VQKFHLHWKSWGGCVSMARKKRQFHCEKCSSPCMIYRKGKAHRVLVCPRCGILATNPFSFKRALGGGLTGAAAGAPIAGVGAIPGAIGGALIGGFTGGDDAPRSPAPSTGVRSSDRFTTEERVQIALR